jgi:hypothetical protein
MMGNTSAHELFEKVRAERITDVTKPARDFSDYRITLDGKELKEFKTIVSV